MNHDNYISPREAMSKLKVSDQTLRKWANEGQIKFITTKGGHRRYEITDILGCKPTDIKRRDVCYCRVSTRGQLDDLRRQQELFRIKYPHHEIVTDTGSGLNFRRKQFNALLDAALMGNIREIVVTHKDRLCRFGFPLIERMVTSNGGHIVVLDQTQNTAEQELINDLISIITCFSSRVYGLRSHKIKKEIKAMQTALERTDDEEKRTEIENNEI
jgi:putative resolvase